MLTVYTTQTCAYCAMVKKYLTSKNVPFETVDVTDDLATQELLKEKTGYSGVPVTTNGNEYVLGFKTGELQKLLA